MADIPPNADATTERNHSRDGGEDQQQSAVLPPSPSDTPGNQVAAGVTATANASSAEQPGADGGADPPAPPPSGPASYSFSAGQRRPVDSRVAAVSAADTTTDSGDAGSPAYRDYQPPTCDPHTQHRRHPYHPGGFAPSILRLDWPVSALYRSAESSTRGAPLSFTRLSSPHEGRSQLANQVVSAFKGSFLRGRRRLGSLTRKL